MFIFRYTLRNVARCWTYETSLLVNEEISNDIPDSLYKDFFQPDYNLHPEFVHKHDNANSKQYLELITKTVYDNLKMVAFSPSVQMQDMIGKYELVKLYWKKSTHMLYFLSLPPPLPSHLSIYLFFLLFKKKVKVLIWCLGILSACDHLTIDLQSVVYHKVPS